MHKKPFFWLGGIVLVICIVIATVIWLHPSEKDEILKVVTTDKGLEETECEYCWKGYKNKSFCTSITQNRKIRDNYEKVVLAGECDNLITQDGIKIIKLTDFLLE